MNIVSECNKIACPFCEGEGKLTTKFRDGASSKTDCGRCGGSGFFTMDEIKKIMIDAKVIDRVVPTKALLLKKILEAAIVQGKSGRFDLTDNPHDYNSEKNEWRTWNQGFTRGVAEAEKNTNAMKVKMVLWRCRPGQSRPK